MMPSSSSACTASENPPCGRPSAAADLVRDAVGQLSDRHRAMIYQSYYLRRTTRQIAAELSTDDDVIKDELHHALHALRMTLQSAGERPHALGVVQ